MLLIISFLLFRRESNVLLYIVNWYFWATKLLPLVTANCTLLFLVLLGYQLLLNRLNFLGKLVGGASGNRNCPVGRLCLLGVLRLEPLKNGSTKLVLLLLELFDLRPNLL